MLEVRVQFSVGLHDESLAFGHFSSYPNLMDNLGDELRFIPLSIGLILIAWVEDGELTHSLSVLDQVIHALNH